MPTYTTTYSLGKPVVGADEDAWGDTLNTSLDAIDDILDGTVPVTGIDINSGTLDGVTIGGTTAGAGTFTTLAATTSITGTLATAAQPNVTSLGTLTSLAVSGDVTFGDNDKAIFGAGSDLQIYHSGAASFISDQGTGNLKVLAQDFAVNNPADTANMITAAVGGAVTAFYDGGVKLATTSTGIDVTGTVTADGLTVDGDASVITLNNTDTSLALGQTLGEIKFNQNDPSDQGVGTVASIEVENAGSIAGYGKFNFKTGSATSLLDRLSITEGGDISFYEDTGTTPKFFWDASAEKLGLNTTSPAALLDLKHNSASTHLRLTENTSGNWSAFGVDTSDNLRVYVNNTEAMRIDSSGNVLIGGTTVATSSGGLNVEVSSSGSTVSPLTLQNQSTGNGSGVYLTFRGQRNTGAQADYTYIQSVADDTTAGNGSMRFHTNGGGTIAERMRIDSSGNLLVGKTSDSFSTQGQVFAAGGYTDLTRAGTVLNVNRLTSDGDIVKFYKDGTTVGSIGTLTASGVALQIKGEVNAQPADIVVKNSGGSAITYRFHDSLGFYGPDATQNLGRATARWKDAYLSGGVYLGGTGAANKLDDYESGSFDTHIYDDHDNSLKISFTGQGSYIKVGNVLSFHGGNFANGVASTTFTGRPYIQLPFTVAGRAGTIAYLGYYNGLGNAQQMYVLGSNSNKLRFATTVTNPYNNQVSTGETWGGNMRAYFSGTVIINT